MLARELIKPGAKFHDTGLASQPEHYRVHIVDTVNEEGFTAKHLATQVVREFPFDATVLKRLKGIGKAPIAQVDFDALIGDEIGIDLVYGSRITGICSAVIYHMIKVEDREYRQIAAIELDRSGSTQYPWHEITSIERL